MAVGSAETSYAVFMTPSTERDNRVMALVGQDCGPRGFLCICVSQPTEYLSYSSESQVLLRSLYVSKPSHKRGEQLSSAGTFRRQTAERRGCRTGGGNR